MKKNAGTLDRLIRIVLALVIIVAGFYYQSLLALVAVIPLVSGITGFCPLYAAFDLSTCGVQKRGYDYK